MSAGGVERFTDGDHVGMDVAGGGNAGDAVQVTGEREVTVVATQDADVDGVLGNDAAAGERVRVDLGGITEFSVADGTSAGVNLTASATAGQMRELNTSGQTGESAQTKTYKTITAEANGTAMVRFG